MEKKSAAATNAKVSKYIPEDIAFFNTTSCIVYADSGLSNNLVFA
jgi:hypothetical protein